MPRRTKCASPDGKIMNTTVRALLTAGLLVVTFGIAVAKLPPPPPMDDKAKAAAEEKKAKDAAAAAAEKAALDRAMDRVQARYIADMKAKGIEVHPTPVAPAETPAPPTPKSSATPAASPVPTNEAKK